MSDFRPLAIRPAENALRDSFSRDQASRLPIAASLHAFACALQAEALDRFGFHLPRAVDALVVVGFGLRLSVDEVLDAIAPSLRLSA